MHSRIGSFGGLSEQRVMYRIADETAYGVMVSRGGDATEGESNNRERTSVRKESENEKRAKETERVDERCVDERQRGERQ